MLTWIGFGLVIAGVLVGLFGDKKIDGSKRRVMKLVEWPKGRAKKLKVVIGIALIYAGFMFIQH